MRIFLGLLMGVVFLTGLAAAEDIPYGRNPEHGAFAAVNGIQLYYEDYGQGQVLLQLHGNGQGLDSMVPQLDFFPAHFRVIAPDSRGHGQSEIGEGRLTYEQMAEDLNQLLEQLELEQVYVLGWSDGGIVGLILAMTHPQKVAKLAVMGANLAPEGAYPWALAWLARQEAYCHEMIAQGDTTGPWSHFLQMLDLLGKQPDIPLTDLAQVVAPTLVISGDRDVIRLEHTVEMFQHLPRAQLAIFPGATHGLPAEDPERFNAAVLRFFQEPFSMPDTRTLFEQE